MLKIRKVLDIMIHNRNWITDHRKECQTNYWFQFQSMAKLASHWAQGALDTCRASEIEENIVT